MQQYGIEGDQIANYDKPLPAPFMNRPGLGERLYVRSLTRWGCFAALMALFFIIIKLYSF